MATPTERKQANYDIAWNAAVTQRTFSRYTLNAETGISHKLIGIYLGQWERAGKIEFSHKGDRGRAYFRVTNQAAKESAPPKTHPDGMAIRSQSARGNMWRSMRGLPSFTARDIAVHSCTDTVKVSEEAATDFCRMLARSGYLRIVQKAVPGRRPTIYRMARNTGPYPPQERRLTAVYDPNTDDYPYIAGVTQ